MREIKFRAFDVVTNIMWIAPEQLHFENDTLAEVVYQISWYCSEEDINWAKIENVVMMQFIGQVDANGVEIYEGDIVRGPDGLCTDDPAHNGGYWPTGVVVYENARFTVKSESTHWDHDESIDWSDVEVIGNEFEDEELL